MTALDDLDLAVDDALSTLDDETETTTRPAPYITAVAVVDLFVDHSYQRDLDQLRTQRMIEDFDPTLLGVLEVSDRGDGTFAVIDGQHRWAACREAHPERERAHLVCQVHRGLTVEDEARVFYEVDVRRKPLSGWDRWKARRGTGDPVVIEIERIVTEAGLQVDPASRDGKIGATKALEIVYELGGTRLLSETLHLLVAAFGKVRDAADALIVRGIAIVLDSYDRDELDYDRLAVALSAIAPRQIKARASALKELHRAELPRLVASVMVERYNSTAGRNLEPLLQRRPAGARVKVDAATRRRDAIRLWANRNGWHIDGRGDIPKAATTAYNEAHPE